MPPVDLSMHSKPAAQSASAVQVDSFGWHQEPEVWQVGSVMSGQSQGGHSVSGAQAEQAHPVPTQISSALQAQPSLQSPSVVHVAGWYWQVFDVVGVQDCWASQTGHSQAGHSPSAGQAHAQGVQALVTQGTSTWSQVNPAGQSASAVQEPSDAAAPQNHSGLQSGTFGHSVSGGQAGVLQGLGTQICPVPQSPSEVHGTSAPRAGTARNIRVSNVIVNFMGASSRRCRACLPQELYALPVAMAMAGERRRVRT